MSEVEKSSVWVPAQFPIEGRLPNHPEQVKNNFWQQGTLARDYHNARCVAAGRRLMGACTKTLNITLCFDGTGNNINNDVYEATPPHPTNVARMFRASIGEGVAGGTGHVGSKARRLNDESGAGIGEYFKYYIPGVGTPFAEVGDLDYTGLGQGFGLRGEERINWALLMLVDVLRRALKQPRLDNVAMSSAVMAMTSIPGMESITGQANRSREFNKQLGAFYQPLKFAIDQPFTGHPKLLGMKLFIYGFSRGAAAARAFVSWLNWLLTEHEGVLGLKVNELWLPVSVEYLGVIDTVASVGLADIVPGAQGHMGWADGTQQLPGNGLVKRCLHIVASHEQRLSFPLESIRRESGEYPENSVEVIYPGVHSDQGGGYPRGAQGKAIGDDDRLLLSQIALNDLYDDAFTHGAPLKVPKDALPADSRSENWRAMAPELVEEFGVSPILIDRFNAWRHVTLGASAEIAQGDYFPCGGISASLEEVLRDQMDWFSAWRVDRYGFDSLKNAPFYLQASDTHSDKDLLKVAKTNHSARQASIEKGRLREVQQLRAGIWPAIPFVPGLPAFEPDLAQTQLREAAEEFRREYRGRGLLENLVVRTSRLSKITGAAARVLTAAARAERNRMKSAGQSRVSLLFPPPALEINHHDERRRGNVDEASNANSAQGLLRALFDDHVHDSRASFLYSLGRERGGHYFSERMVFFGDSGRRELALYEETQTEVLALVAPAPGSVAAGTGHASSVAMDPDKLARAHEEIDKLWANYQAKYRGEEDAQV